LAHSLSPAPSRLGAQEENPMTFPLDLLVALTPFIVLGILSLIGK
jgi:hypothetical protein